jgi:hypothetical protein
MRGGIKVTKTRPLDAVISGQFADLTEPKRERVIHSSAYPESANDGCTEEGWYIETSDADGTPFDWSGPYDDEDDATRVMYATDRYPHRGEIWRHTKTGGLYIIIEGAGIITTNRLEGSPPQIIYTPFETPGSAIYIRAWSEFVQGMRLPGGMLSQRFVRWRPLWSVGKGE